MKTISDQPCIAGVIVSYNPDLAVLRQLVEAVLPQVDHLIIIDNGQGIEFGPAVARRLEIIPLGDNLGIAKAQNEGIARARALGATHVLLLDQDSMPDDGMVAALLTGLRGLEAAGCKVACVGPNYQDQRHANAKPFVRLEGLSFARQSCEGRNAPIEVDFLIASGCLTPLSVLDVTGPMVDDLFIDYVDIEWGLRARSKGFKSYGVCEARMHHALGDAAVRLGGKTIPVHSPLRQYYNVRNAVWLCRQNFVSLQWRLALVFRTAQLIAFYTLLSPPRLTRLRMMMRGLGDGIFNRMGKYRGKG